MPLLNDYYEYTIAKHYVSAIINDDYTGLSDEEENDLARFLSQANNLPNATWQIEPDQDSENLAICEISELLADCYEVRLYFTNETLEA